MEEELPSQALHSIIHRQNVNTLSVLHIWASLNGHNVAETHAKIVSNNSVHANFFVGASLVGQYYADRFLASFALQQHCVTAEEL